ncbi:MAG: argininosuccinate lyase, partial [Clostridia bacterium]|nr:argininosuccinate lyase [Clostridia bacterium]
DRLYQAARGGFTNATDIADYLVKKGIPFRESHEIIGRMVAYCIEKGKSIDEMSMDEFYAFSDKIESDVYTAISLETCVNERKVPGGPSKESVMASVESGKSFLAAL